MLFRSFLTIQYCLAVPGCLGRSMIFLGRFSFMLGQSDRVINVISHKNDERNHLSCTSWWFFTPFEKYAQVKIGFHFLNEIGVNIHQKSLEPPPRLILVSLKTRQDPTGPNSWVVGKTFSTFSHQRLPNSTFFQF